MGCDGGTIPKRIELVRTKKKAEKVDKDAKNIANWQFCHLSQMPLQEPIVACELGWLYNKENVIEYLLDRASFESGPQYIRSMKDLKELKLTPNKNYKGPCDEKRDDYRDLNASKWVCPVTGLEINASYSCCLLWKCGCVFTEKALKEVKSETCHACGCKFEEEDIVSLIPDEEVIRVNEERMCGRREKAKLSRKSKKAEKKKLTVEEDEESGATAGAAAGPPPAKKMTREASVPGPSKASTVAPNIAQIAREAVTKPYKTIQDDPKASKVYKNLFNTCEDAKTRPTAHWISCNPQYY